jgi:hypothetical protein
MQFCKPRNITFVVVFLLQKEIIQQYNFKQWYKFNIVECKC